MRWHYGQAAACRPYIKYNVNIKQVMSRLHEASFVTVYTESDAKINHCIENKCILFTSDVVYLTVFLRH